MEDLKEYAPHEQRVLIEKSELSSKLESLKAFFNTDVFKRLERDERDLLQQQAQAMDTYSRILDARIAVFSPGFKVGNDAHFSFGHAVKLLKFGERLARRGWNGASMFVYYVPAAKYPAQRNSKNTMLGMFENDMVPYRAYLALKTADNDVATWAPSTSDTLAEDWYIV